MIVKYEDLTDQEKAEFDKLSRDAEKKEVDWFLSRGFEHQEIMAAGFAFKAYLEVEQRLPNNKPFDKAPGFKRIFICGYVLGMRSK